LIQQMMQAIRQLADITTILLVEQNFRVASQLGRQYAIIENGQSVHYGLMEDLIDNEKLIQHYLGAA